MAQITWQNINDRPLSDGVVQPLALAQRSIGDIFTTARAELDRFQETENKNWNTQSTNNTEEFRNAMRGARAPEEFAAMQASGGVLDLMKQRMGAQYDQKAIGSELDGRESVLQNRVLANQAFGDNRQEVAGRPLTEQIQLLTALGKSDEAKALAQNSTLRNRAALVDQASNAGYAATQRDQQLTNFNNTQTKFGWEKEAAPINLSNLKIEGQLKEAQAAELRAKSAHKDTTSFINNLFTTGDRAYNSSVAQRNADNAQLVKDAGVPMKNGQPDLSAMDAAGITKLGDLMKSRGLDVPTPDTSFYTAKMVEQIRNSNLPPDEKISYIEQANKLFTTPGLSAEAKSSNNAKLTALDSRIEAAKKNNPFYGNDADNFAGRTAVLDKLTKFQDGFGNLKGKFQNQAVEWMTTGMDIPVIKDGKASTEKQIIPPKLLQEVLAQTYEEDPWGKNKTMINAEEKIKSYLATPGFKQKLDEATELQAGSKRAALLNDIRNQENEAGVVGTNKFGEAFARRQAELEAEKKTLK